jgi:hypothetical protein
MTKCETSFHFYAVLKNGESHHLGATKEWESVLERMDAHKESNYRMKSKEGDWVEVSSIACYEKTTWWQGSEPVDGDIRHKLTLYC